MTTRNGWGGRSVVACVGLLLAAPVLVGAAARLWRDGAYQVLNLPAYDYYRYTYPNIEHALRALRTGDGVLWNPYQACGAPFFANIQAGLLYPLTLPMWVLERDPALVVNVLAHLCIVGVGMLMLARALGLSITAALCGGLALQFSGAVLILATWGPILIGTFAWMPVALWRTERLVQAPGVRNAGWLALVLTLQLLAGLPQTLFFTYQLIALRIAWALLVRESRPPLTLVLLTAVAGLLPLGLAAVQLVPAMEMAGESLRQLPLDTSSIGPGFSWHRLATMAGALVVFPVDRLLLVFVAFSLPALRHVNDRRHVAFWGLIAVAYLVLSLGPGSLLWVIYEQLPLGSAFRGSQRLIWVVALALSLLVAFGSETIVARLPRALRWLPPLAIFVCAVSFGASPLRSVRGDAAYDTHAEAWSFVRQHLTAVDRVAIVGGELPDFAVMPKSASLFAVPAIYDYEPQMSLRYAEYFSWMRTGHSLRSVRDWYWVHDKLLPRTLRPTLFDLTAARLVLVEAKNDVVEEVFGPSVRLVGEPGGVRVYENTRALPRVRWVPAAVVRPADTTLAELARPEHEPRRVVVLERAPVSAFLGDAASTKATVVDLVSQRAERLSVRLRAPAPGFLVVADQWFPGWRATVNGGVAEILRADYAFRAVEVPAGDVEVVFQYRPFSVLLGAVVSVLSAIGFVVAMRRGS